MQKELIDINKLSEENFIRHCIDGYPSIKQKKLISEHAEENRFFPDSAPRKGRLSLRGSPYIREIMDNCVPWSPIQQVTVLKSHQSSLTMMGESIMGYFIEYIPCEQAYYTATEKMIKKWMPRFEAMVDSYSMRHLFRTEFGPKNKNIKGDLKFQKHFNGCQLNFNVLGSIADASGASVQIVYIDELDQVKHEFASGHGDLMKTIWGRTSAYRKTRKVIIYSTPGLKATSLTFREYEKGDKRLWYVTCPHCGHEQNMTSDNLWHKKSKFIEDASLICKGSKECEMKNHDKFDMFDHSYWKPSAKNNIDPLHRSYHINALMSPPWAITFTEFLKEKLEAEDAAVNGDESLLKTFTNIYEGLPYEPKGKRPKWQKNNPLRQYYPSGTIHEDVLFIGVAGDVQRGFKDPAKKQPARIEINVFGFTTLHRTFLIEHKVFEGEITTADGSAFLALDRFLEDKIDNPYKRNGTEFKIVSTFLDSGDGDKQKGSMQAVYDFCEPRVRCYPIKGFATIGKDYDPSIDTKKTQNSGRYKKKKLSTDLTLIEIATNYYKEQLYSYISKTQSNIHSPDYEKKYGYLGFPKDYTDSMFDQLNSAERLENNTYDTKGRIHEQLDLYVYGLCLADMYLDDYTYNYRQYLLEQGANPNKIEKFRKTTSLRMIELHAEELNLGTKKEKDELQADLDELFT